MKSAAIDFINSFNLACIPSVVYLIYPLAMLIHLPDRPGSKFKGHIDSSGGGDGGGGGGGDCQPS